jgi:hypothetical protein
MIRDVDIYPSINTMNKESSSQLHTQGHGVKGDLSLHAIATSHSTCSPGPAHFCIVYSLIFNLLIFEMWYPMRTVEVDTPYPGPPTKNAKMAYQSSNENPRNPRCELWQPIACHRSNIFTPGDLAAIPITEQGAIKKTNEIFTRALLLANQNSSRNQQREQLQHHDGAKRSE